MKMDQSVNVLGTALESCCQHPVTGFFRDGHCNTCEEDIGSHTVCVILTNEFLAFSKYRGNDLSTPRPEFGFPGLQAGDRWCLCATRWMEAYQNDRAPKIKLTATHARALEIIPLALLKSHAVDLN
ncbi:MAG: DUF2237 domain-containing protein [Hahellaceae bacterium]|nr:DUF2237 domain-containing protein [Hahellaceae bacterium]MCP5169354.1 DUF2237 domain-containing protein [Hahellaceae bacterium]